MAEEAKSKVEEPKAVEATTPKKKPSGDTRAQEGGDQVEKEAGGRTYRHRK